MRNKVLSSTVWIAESTAAMDLQNVDQEAAYRKFYADLQLPGTQNFAVQFDADKASCAVDISRKGVQDLLESRRHDPDNQKPCLWINLWGWGSEHQAIVKLVADHYDVSPRLAHVICPTPSQKKQIEQASMFADKGTNFQHADAAEKASLSSPASGRKSLDTARTKRTMPKSIADIANDLWHFCTVDFGRRYICICWNALYFLHDECVQNSTGKPKAIRVWSSLLLCDDGTVVSTFESPENLDGNALKGIRNNQTNVFKHLSRFGATTTKDNALMHIDIRHFHVPQPQTSTASVNNMNLNSEMASLLFYYLFDDWFNIYHQAIGGENSYRDQLEDLRQQMTKSAEVDQVTLLHLIGRELSVLRAVYRSYQTIIEQIVQKQRRQKAKTNTNMPGRSASDFTRTSTLLEQDSHDPNELQESNIQIAVPAVTRFERLRDRIDLCAMTEVEECIKEKDDLVFMVSLTPFATCIR